jgi:hypothetical protein
VAAHCSKRGALVDRSQEDGDQVRECRLKSPRRSVGTVGSKSRERSVLSDVAVVHVVIEINDSNHVFMDVNVSNEYRGMLSQI